MLTPVKNIARQVLDIFYPRVCAACLRVLQKNEYYLCLYCHNDLPQTQFHMVSPNVVEKIFWGRLAFEHATSFLYFKKGGKVQRLMHQFKYKGHKEIGIEAGKWFGHELKRSPYFQDLDLIIPVPLHPKKLRKRGYNQSDYLAKGLSIGLGVSMDADTLVRTSYSSTQTRKSRYERWENVSRIFQLKQPSRVYGKHILLVDDVITTGATLEACGQIVGKEKGTRLSLASLALATKIP